MDSNTTAREDGGRLMQKAVINSEQSPWNTAGTSSSVDVRSWVEKMQVGFKKLLEMCVFLNCN